MATSSQNRSGSARTTPRIRKETIYGWLHGPVILRVEAGDPIVLLAGVHVGCFELFATDRVRSIRDLKRLREGGMIKSSPQRIIAQGTTDDFSTNSRRS